MKIEDIKSVDDIIDPSYYEGLFTCSECESLTELSAETKVSMRSLGLNEFDIHIKCKECKDRMYHTLVRLTSFASRR